MAKTLLNAVNDLFKRAELIAGDAAALTGITDTARQNDIDVCIQVINEAIEELYSTAEQAMPQQQASSSITLATNTRNYTLATNYVQLLWPLIDTTHTQFIWEHKPGYNDLLFRDPEGDDTGIPILGVIRPTDAALYVYPTPTSTENGKVYTYQYKKDTSLSLATDTVPFSNTVYRAMVPVWFQLWQRERRNEFDADLFKGNLGRAARLLSQVPPRTHYSPR